MRQLVVTVIGSLLVAAPVLAQERGTPEPRGFVTVMGAFSTSTGETTANSLLEGGVRFAPHLIAFGNLGRFSNLQSELQPGIDSTTAALAANQGLDVTASATLPATFGIGGIRFELPSIKRVIPYGLGGIGAAHLHPETHFSFADGAMPDGSSPDIGADVTAALLSNGDVSALQATNERVETAGAGVQIPLGRRWNADVGYRYFRMEANSDLGSAPLNLNSMSLGVGLRF